jgi:hypothetical protein
VLKKCVKLPSLAHHLVKDCGLLLWLSSVISIGCERSNGVENTCSRATELAVEVKYCCEMFSAILHASSEGFFSANDVIFLMFLCSCFSISIKLCLLSSGSE